MNLFDLIDDLDLLPRHVARAAAGTLLVAITFVPSVQRFYVAQAKEHGEQLVRILMRSWPTAPTNPNKPMATVP